MKRDNKLRTVVMFDPELDDSNSLVRYVTAGIVKWPMSVIRLQSKDRKELTEVADFIFTYWKDYRDEQIDLIHVTDGTPHNTITPIARRREDLFELDLVLRNNRTNDQYPMGIFHPHQEVHHIKKENIGLIEVMGLAVLPGRLQEELAQVADCLLKEQYEKEILKNEEIVKHLDWAKQVRNILISMKIIVKIFLRWK